MTTPSGSKSSGATRARRKRPPPGERNRGAVDALQTKIAVNIQHLDQDRFKEQLRDNIAELPDATGCDAAFLALISSDLSGIETVLSSSTGFCSKPDSAPSTCQGFFISSC